MSSILHQFLVGLGTLFLLSSVYKIASFVLLYNRPSGFPRYQPKNGAKAWALVTGSSDGIGKAFAFEFASRGFNVILHGRNAQKLKTVQQELEAKYPGRKFKTLILDASDPSIFTRVNVMQELLEVHPLKVVVNNVGALPPGDELATLHHFDTQALSTNVAINATFPLLFTRAVMPALKASQPSLVLNIGSFADAGMPLLPTYAPSKAFLMTSTKELSIEAEMEGLDIEYLGLRIMQVTGTQVVQLPKSFMVPDTAEWVKLALARVGCGKSVVVPYWPHGIQNAVVESLPDFIQRKFYIMVGKQLSSGGGMKKAEAAGSVKKDL